jgi:hypothetical protein
MCVPTKNEDVLTPVEILYWPMASEPLRPVYQMLEPSVVRFSTLLAAISTSVALPPVIGAE